MRRPGQATGWTARLPALVLRASLAVGCFASAPAQAAGPGPTPAPAYSARPEYRAYTTFGDLIERVRREYVDAVTMQQLLTLALRGMGRSAGPLAPDAPRLIETAVSSIRSASDDRARLLAFTTAVNALAEGQATREHDLLRTGSAWMVAGLDPHSDYTEDTTPRTPKVSVGLELVQVGTQVVVLRPTPGSLAEEAGLLRGDVLTRIDTRPVLPAPLADVMDQLEGPFGSTVELAVRRDGRERTFRVNRQVIFPPALTSALRGTVAVIHPGVLDGRTLPGLRAALQDRTREAGGRLTGLVLDLRGNRGGLLEATTSLASALLPDRSPVVTLKERKAADSSTTFAGGALVPDDMPMVVVVDGTTASGGELVAAALQARRALLLGTRTFGMASVSTVMPLPDSFGRIGTPSGVKGVLRLTTARAWGPDGVSWQRRGLVPDIRLPEASGPRAIHEDDLANALPTPPPNPGWVPKPAATNWMRERWATLAGRPPLAAPDRGDPDAEITRAVQVVNLFADPAQGR